MVWKLHQPAYFLQLDNGGIRLLVHWFSGQFYCDLKLPKFLDLLSKNLEIQGLEK